MRRIEITGLCLMAMLAFGAVAAATASAHAYEVKGGVLPQEITGNTKAGTESLFRSKIAGLTVEFKCKASAIKGSIEKEGLSKGTIEFKSCKIFQVTKEGKEEELSMCKVVEPIVVTFKDKLVGEPVEDKFEPETGEVFTEITITGETCAIQSFNLEVTGTQTCKLPGGEVFAKVHTVECTPAGGKLALHKAVAEFTSTQEIELKSGLEFRIK